MRTKPNQHISQRGFIPVLLIVLGVISIVGLSVGGYYVFKNKEASVASMDKPDVKVIEDGTDVASSTDQSDNPTNTNSGAPFNLEDFRKKEKVDIFAPEYQKPVLTLNTSPTETKGNLVGVLAQLEGELTSLNELFDVILDTKKTYVEYAQTSASTRAEELGDFADLIHYSDIQDFTEDYADSFNKYSKNAKSEYDDVYAPFERAVKERLGTVQTQIDLLRNNKVASDSQGVLDVINTRAEKYNLFLSYLEKFNDSAYRLEKMQEDKFTTALDQIDSLIEIRGVSSSIDSMLTSLRQDAFESSVEKEVRCFGTTKYSGGINGTAETTLRCE